ncbi:MAG TPA: hypothetical protein PK280_07205 [Planctomycetota bacterium]|nr:hypothetical protein [Planctomycetota bacterium]
MWRIWLGMAVVGVIVLVYGFNEARVSFGASSKPQEVALADLEAGKAVDNTHLLIGKHVAIFTETIFQYEVRKHGPSTVTPSTRVDFAYYPIISPDHPYVRKCDEVLKKYGGPDKVPEKEWPSIGSFAVLVKTSGFATVGNIPTSDAKYDRVQGTVINRIKKLEGQEAELLHGSFPQVNLDKVLILESGRTPTSILLALMIMIVGLGITGAAGAIPWYLARSKREEERRSAERRQARLDQARARAREVAAAGQEPAAAGEEAGEPPADGPEVSGGAAAQPGAQVRRGVIRPMGGAGAAGGAKPPFRPGQIRRRPPT